MKDLSTLLARTEFPRNDPYGALQMPIYQNVAFEFNSAEAMELAFCGKTEDPTYSRIANPTVRYLEDKIAAITNAVSVTALSSGMAAISNTLMTIAYNGGNIITSKHLFGNTYSLLTTTLAPFGIETRLCDLCNPEDVSNHIDTNTFAIFLEIITNPQMEVANLKALADIAHQKHVPLIADSTVVPFCAFAAKRFGVDIEVVSSTKYISGGATSLGGLILDYGTFDWQSSQRLQTLAQQQPNAFTYKMKREIHRNFGAYMTPQAAALQTLGLDTMELRFHRAAQTTRALAEDLCNIKDISAVNYTGLPNNPYYHVSTQQFGEYPCAMLTFDLPTRKHCFGFLNNLKLIKRATNLFDNKTLAIHPESTIFGTFSAPEKEFMNIRSTTIRLSVGLENKDALLEDILQATSAASN
jgi:O-acetylhomoserine (thiol)-lyase